MGTDYYFTFVLGDSKLAGYVNAEDDIKVRKMFRDYYEVQDMFITPINYTKAELTLDNFITEITRLKENGRSLGERKKEFELYIEKLKEALTKSTNKLESICNEIEENNVNIAILEEKLCKLVK